MSYYDNDNNTICLYSTAGCFRAYGSKLFASNSYIGRTGRLEVPRLNNNHRRILTTPGAVFDAAMVSPAGNGFRNEVARVETFKFKIAIDFSDLPTDEGGNAVFVLVFEKSGEKVMPPKNGYAWENALTKCGRAYMGYPDVEEDEDEDEDEGADA